MKTNLVTVFALSFSLVLFLNCNPESAPNEQVPTSSATWDSVQFWNLSTDVTTVAELVNFNGQNNNGLRIDYQFGNSGWFNLELTQQKPVNTDSSIVFYLKSTSSNYIELVGHYNPHDDSVTVNGERVLHWMGQGAQVSDTVHNLLVSQKVIEGKKKNVLSKKTPIKKEVEAVAAEAPAESQKEEVA